MVTAMVVMTQSEYIARGKQGQEYSRPEKGCWVQSGTTSLQSRDVCETVSSRWSRRVQQRRGQPPPERNCNGHPHSNGTYELCFCAPKLLLPLSLHLLASANLGKTGENIYIFTFLLEKKGSLLFASPIQHRDCAHFLKFTCSVSPCLTTALGIYTFTFQIEGCWTQWV